MKDITKNSPESVKKPVILVAPLDWGLGHATRCIPLIKTLISLDYEVIIAAEGAQASLLRQEFPGLKHAYLRGYSLEYAGSYWQTLLIIILQIPKILISIKRENRWLNTFLKQNPVNAVISDNRYGLHHADTSCIFITHQLTIKGISKGIGERLLQRINYHFINRFTECWVPDYAGKHNLAGELSHPLKMPAIPVKYIGPLTRFASAENVVVNHLLIILSGPEPQRTILEDILLGELESFDGSVTLVRGLPGSNEELKSLGNLRIFNHLPSQELNDLINTSEIILSRSGYSTIMDMMALNKKCIFIPTPGQTEQIYLAEYLSSKRHCLSYHQHGFSLRRAIKDLSATTLLPFQQQLQEGLETLLRGLRR